MPITDIITQFFIVLIGLILFFLIKNFWPKYFETKGENQATKEDIGEITKIVEEIKTKLSQETELLKAHMSLTNQHRLNIKAAERDALIELNRKGTAWLYSLVRFEFTSYNNENYGEMETEKAEFRRRQYEFDLSQAHLNLFMHDQPLLNLINKFSIAIINFEHRLTDGILDLKHMFANKNIVLQDLNSNKLEIEKEYHNKFMEFYNNYRAESIELFKTAHFAQAELIKVLHKRLRELEEDMSSG